MMLEVEFDSLLLDDTKRIDGDIVWQVDQYHSPAVWFRADVHSAAEYPLVVKGTYNQLIGALSFTLIHEGARRIYGLDLGKDHTNPDEKESVGELHKHHWTDKFRDKHAYVPHDITAPVTRPVEVWQQFCNEARIVHNGVMHEPVSTQMDDLL